MPDQDERRIAAGRYGWLEHPRPGEPFRDSLLIAGWAFDEASPIVSVWAEGPWGRQTLDTGLAREDVAAAYPGRPRAAMSGFAGYIECRSAPSRFTLRVTAETADGRTAPLFSRRIARPSPARQWLRRGLQALARQVRRRPGAPDLVRTAALERRRTARASLDAFLAGGSRLVFPRLPRPAVSTVIVAFNSAELTFACLQSLLRQSEPIEVVVVDNASTDDTPDLLARVDGARIVRRAGNAGFTIGANAGAAAAAGEFLLFVNSDTEVDPDAVRRLVATARRSRAGAVGGKLIFPSGTLQEAGAIVWRDGSCAGYGRYDDPRAPQYNFERPVDFCSAALLLTPRALFEALGGFDEQYRPGYYEDADYCARLWSRGHAVIYQPEAEAVHHEFGSLRTPRHAIRMQRERRSIFAARHRDWLARQPLPSSGVLAARSHPHDAPVVLLVDDAAPDPARGAGFPRTAALLRALDALACRVTVVATSGASSPRARALWPGVEIVPARPETLDGVLRPRLDRCPPGSLLLVSRPHNMRYVRTALGPDLAALGLPCVYDAEAIFADREISRRAAEGRPLGDVERTDRVRAEVDLARGAACVLAVSDRDRRVFEAHGVTDVIVAAHAVEPRPTPRPACERNAILFVGAFGTAAEISPNEDAVHFLCGRIRPALRSTPAARASIVVAGAGIPAALQSQYRDVTWIVDGDDLTASYDDARVFVAPTRFAAGIPLKIVEAAARGVPVVCTPLLAAQLGWTPGVELLTADAPAAFGHAINTLFDTPALWEAVREAAIARVTRDYGPDVFQAAIVSAFETAHRASRDSGRRPPAPAPRAAGTDGSRPA